MRRRAEEPVAAPNLPNSERPVSTVTRMRLHSRRRGPRLIGGAGGPTYLAVRSSTPSMPVAAARTVLLTPDEYVAWEERQDIRHEYAFGEVFPMPGGTFAHFLIISNLAFALRVALAGRAAFVLADGMRLQIHGDRYVYPDVSVILGEPAFRDDRRTTLTNPTLVAEVLSRSTAAYDRGEKLALYGSVASIQEVVLVDAEARRVEVARRTEGGWDVGAAATDGEVRLESLGVAVALTDVYRLVDGLDGDAAG